MSPINPDAGRLTASSGWIAPRSALDALGITITDQEPHMSTPRTYVKKPVAIEAIQWTGQNTAEVQKFADRAGFGEVDRHKRTDDPDIAAEVWDKLHSTWVGVKVGQWIIRGVQGEYYPCDPDVFEATYEEQA